MPRISLPSKLNTLLRRCLKTKALIPAKQLHAQLLTSGINIEPGNLCAKLVALYASCGELNSASLLLTSLTAPTALAWNWIILGYAFRGSSAQALRSFSQMLASTALPNHITFSNTLKACVGILNVNRGREVHCLAVTRGFGGNVSVANALVDMYSKCGCIGYAHKVFDKMPHRDVVSWTCIITGCSGNGSMGRASEMFERMKSQGLKPNRFAWNAMITGYLQNGDCNAALGLFPEMNSIGLEPDLVSWNAMIAGLGRNNRCHEALRFCSDMIVSGCKPNAVTVAGLLPACGRIGSLEVGKQVHGFVYRWELHEDVFMGTALIDMYSKCGSVVHAGRVFDQMEVKNVATWNAVIGCYGKHGEIDVSVQLFERMLMTGVQADHITFACLLSACSHAGLVGKGLELFRSIIEPTGEHYACVIDMLCRFGHFEEAYEIVKMMPMAISESVVGAFINGCRIHGRIDRKTLENLYQRVDNAARL